MEIGTGGDQAAGPAIRVLVVDGHELTRAGLRQILSDEPGLELVGEACDGAAAMDLCERLRPDVVLMDVRMAVLDGIEATRRLSQQLPSVHVVIFTACDDPDVLFQALKAGARGYLLKDAPRSALVAAVARAAAGESTLSEDVATRLLHHLARPAAARPYGSPEALTPRERDVLGLLARGHTNKEIASRLAVAAGTVKIHVEHILGKLGAADRTEAAVRAVELGLVARASADSALDPAASSSYASLWHMPSGGRSPIPSGRRV